MAYRKSLSKILNGVTRFGKLTVLGDGPPKISPSGFEARTALVRCDCGSEKVVRAGDLRNGYSLSCGCEQRRLLGQTARIRARTHGESRGGGSVEYRTWGGMKQRCHNPNYHGFAEYGGRGIFVCDRWRGQGGFENFLADMGRRPEGEYSIDRINNDGPYSPENCRWATVKQQAKNRRSTVLITIDGETRSVVEWARVRGFPESLIYLRLRAGWSERDAVMKPKRSVRRAAKLL